VNEHRPGSKLLISQEGLKRLMAALSALGDLIGPKAIGGVLTYARISGPEDMPRGMTDEQSAGRYRLLPSGREAYFDFTLGAQGWKSFFSPPSVELFSVTNGADGYTITQSEPALRPLVLFGVRPCELAAIAMQDKIYTQGDHVDQVYAARRKGAFIVAINCARPSGGCFCVSMGTGPKAQTGFDIAITEVLEGKDHFFLAEPGSAAGEKFLSELGFPPAGDGQVALAEKTSSAAAGRMGKAINQNGLKDALYASYDHPQWAKTGQRCLSCGSCAAVCPTCFCLKYEDYTDLSGKASRKRGWDVCLGRDYSYIHGGPARPSAMARYRHFVIHKLASWIDQFGSPGCVGCGRCIVWCPAGIDITQHAAAIGGAAKPGGGS